MRCGVALTIALLVLAAGDAPAQSAAAALVAPATPDYVAPRTSWGDPSLEGIWPGTGMVRVPFERPRQYGTRVRMTPEEHAVVLQREQERIERTIRDGAGGALGAPGHWIEWGETQLQTSLLVDPPDGRMPALTPAGRARQDALPRGSAGGGILNGPEDFSMWERCISRGVLGSTLPSLYNSGIDITQAPGYVAIRYEMVHDTRVIPLDARPHLPSSLRQYMGDARGRWEGDTLVVETQNFTDRIGFGPDGGGAPPGPSARLVERFTRVSDDTLRYEATVHDPETWVAPWTVAFPLKLQPDYVMAEYACHEGNLGLRYALSGSRAEEEKGMGK